MRRERAVTFSGVVPVFGKAALQRQDDRMGNENGAKFILDNIEYRYYTGSGNIEYR